MCVAWQQGKATNKWLRVEYATRKQLWSHVEMRQSRLLIVEVPLYYLALLTSDPRVLCSVSNSYSTLRGEVIHNCDKMHDARMYVRHHTCCP